MKTIKLPKIGVSNRRLVKKKNPKSKSHKAFCMCPACKSKKIITSYLTGETFCSKCGLVLF